MNANASEQPVDTARAVVDGTNPSLLTGGNAILDSLPVGALALDLAGRVEYANEAALRMLQLRQEETAGMDVHAFMPDSHSGSTLYPDRECPVCRTARTSEAVRIGHDVFWRPNRTSFPVEYTVAPVSGQGKPVGLVVCFTDQSRDEIHAPEMMHVLASAQCLLWYADVQYVREKDRMRWFMWPADLEAARRFLPFPMAEDQSFAEAFYASRLDEDKERTNDFGKAEILAGRGYSQEYRCRREDGQIRWIAEHVQVEAIAEDRWRAAGVCTDVTDLKEREVEIERLNVQLQRAMTETHHRVKNNLQVISALIDVQTLDHSDAVPIGEFRRLSTHVRTLAVVHDILTGESKRGGEVDTVPACEILERLLGAAAMTIGSRPMHVRLDDIRISSRQATALAIIANELVSNAAKHGRGPIEVEFVEEGDHVGLRVADDGSGFPDNFDPTRDANTGLELVTNLARWDLGGNATFYNRGDQRGAVAEVTFPAGSNA